MQILKKLWRSFSRPNSRYALGTLLVVGAIGGVLFWGSFHWAIELSSTETFCISCHEMRSTVYEELKKSPHYINRSGVRATCSDCHVPKEWIYKIKRKMQATIGEVPMHLIGAVNTPEKFEAKRLELAQRVWDAMKKTDSRECRNCHDTEFMDLANQAPRARGQHESAITTGETCIDCHKGIAHKAVHQALEEQEGQENGGFTLE